MNPDGSFRRGSVVASNTAASLLQAVLGRFGQSQMWWRSGDSHRGHTAGTVRGVKSSRLVRSLIYRLIKAGLTSTLSIASPSTRLPSFVLAPSTSSTQRATLPTIIRHCSCSLPPEPASIIMHAHQSAVHMNVVRHIRTSINAGDIERALLELYNHKETLNWLAICHEVLEDSGWLLYPKTSRFLQGAIGLAAFLDDPSKVASVLHLADHCCGKEFIDWTHAHVGVKDAMLYCLENQDKLYEHQKYDQLRRIQDVASRSGNDRPQVSSLSQDTDSSPLSKALGIR